MSKSNKAVQKDVRPHYLRRLKSGAKVESPTKILKSELIASPLAKYDSEGNLSCAVCRAPVKSASIWKVHINSKQHRHKVEITKQIKDKILTSHNIKIKGNISVAADENINSKSHTVTKVVAGTNSFPPDSQESADILPEKFFDDPMEDAKIRNTQYKDVLEEEWERFQKEIKEESSMSNAIIANEQNEVAADRQIKEIDEQIGLWSRVMGLEEKRRKVFQTSCRKASDQTSVCEHISSEESDSFDEFSDWRSKKFCK